MCAVNIVQVAAGGKHTRQPFGSTNRRNINDASFFQSTMEKEYVKLKLKTFSQLKNQYRLDDGQPLVEVARKMKAIEGMQP